LQRSRRLKISVREIFWVVRFSTFSTASVKSGRTRIEYMSSAVHPITDVGQFNIPQTEQRTGLINMGDTWWGFIVFTDS
jgi:hypothetical protein